MAALEFVLIAPALLMLIFGIVIYSIYFTAVLGVRQAATEGARAAMAGLSLSERQTLAVNRANAVISNYGSLTGAGSTATVTSSTSDGDQVFNVTVAYNMTNSPIMRYNFVPLPSNKTITSTVSVTNGSY